jgi:hypothetical protein
MNNENKFCKYCLDDSEENSQPLIYPCQCSDGIHPNCLAIWMMVRTDGNRNQCEICKTDYVGVDILPPSPPSRPPVIEISFNDETANETPNFVCCHCYKGEGGFYIAGIIFLFSGGALGSGTPRKPDQQAYYMAMVLLVLISCFFFAIALAFTTRRYFKRMQEIRTINTISNDA